MSFRNQPFTHFLLLTIFALFIYAILHPPRFLATELPQPLPTLGSSAPALAPVPKAMPQTSWFQKAFTLPARARGSYLITSEVTSQLPEISNYRVGLLTLFVRHTSCALSLNENWDSDVQLDMSDAMDRIVVEDKRGEGIYRHSAEGSDDMPAHVKSALIGASVTVPITEGKLALGTWQGIWYMEFRRHRHSRSIVATIQGELKE